MSVSERLKREVDARGWSIREFARRVAEKAPDGAKGVTYPSVYEYVDGRVQEPPLPFLRAAAEVLEVRPAWLAFGEEPARDWVEELGPSPREEVVERALDLAGFSAYENPAPPQLRLALIRFAEAVEELNVVDAPWSASAHMLRVLAYAARFVGEVDQIFHDLERRQPGFEFPTYEGSVFPRAFASEAHARRWYDSALELFSQRLRGLPHDHAE